ncbi:hypothetical protein JCM9534A_34470 [Catenuloplanes indicus JCM 9534]
MRPAAGRSPVPVTSEQFGTVVALVIAKVTGGGSGVGCGSGGGAGPVVAGPIVGGPVVAGASVGLAVAAGPVMLGVGAPDEAIGVGLIGGSAPVDWLVCGELRCPTIAT